jgi:predicted RNase H-like nuclease (RuvC/YqgF family)
MEDLYTDSSNEYVEMLSRLERLEQKNQKNRYQKKEKTKSGGRKMKRKIRKLKKKIERLESENQKIKYFLQILSSQQKKSDSYWWLGTLEKTLPKVVDLASTAIQSKQRKQTYELYPRNNPQLYLPESTKHKR